MNDITILRSQIIALKERLNNEVNRYLDSIEKDQVYNTLPLSISLGDMHTNIPTNMAEFFEDIDAFFEDIISTSDEYIGESYKYFMVMDITHDSWMVCVKDNLKDAISLCNEVTIKGCERLEIWATNEDPDTFLAADVVYIKDFKKPSGLAARLYDEEGDASLQDIENELTTIDGCHTYIEYLLDTIDSILNN